MLVKVIAVCVVYTLSWFALLLEIKKILNRNEYNFVKFSG